MNTAKKLKAKKIQELKKRKIDFSDIPELTQTQAAELYPKNWKFEITADSIEKSVATHEKS